MANKIKLPHWGSKGAVNRAGEGLRKKAITESEAHVLESWRMAHRLVIHKFEALLRARSKGKDVQVAQRLKRRSTIVDKLMRYPSMELARMDDVAGCRLIFSSIEALHDFRDKLHAANFNHVLKNKKNKYDYIETPTSRGYRGVHDIFECKSRVGRSAGSDGLLIEIQYRTLIQHAWATAVEVVTQITDHEPKFDRGDRRYIRLFCLASEMLARVHEGRHSCEPALSDGALVEEFDKVENEIHVIRTLLGLALHEWIFDHKEADHIILHVTQNQGFKLHQFDLELQASKKLLELEKEFPEDNIVLVGSKTVEEIESAFRNYFNDVREFIRLFSEARKKLLGNKTAG